MRLDFGKLERRSAPVAYWSAQDQAIHDDIAGTVVPYPNRPRSIGTLTQDGVPSYATIAETDDGPVRLIDADGTARALGSGYVSPDELVVSPDRRKVGWRGSGSDSDPDSGSRAMVADVASGRVLAELDLGGAGSVGPFYSAELLHVVSESGGSGDDEVLRLSDGIGYSLDSAEATTGAPNAHLMLPIDSPDDGGGQCVGVFQLAQFGIAGQLGDLVNAEIKPRWQTCGPEASLATVRIDGKYVIVGRYDRRSRTQRLGMVELASGRRVLDIGADQLDASGWSDDGDQFVVEARAGKQFALVTCDVAGPRAGSCGLSTDPRPELERASRYGSEPYVLAGEG